MGALVTVELPGDSPVLEMPWIITFGPLREDEDWEPVVCGPYERSHALMLAESVVGDDDLMAVVEPLLPRASVDEIRGEIATARLAAEAEPAESDYGAEDGAEYRAEFAPGAGRKGRERPYVEPTTPPTVDEIKAGFARIAARLTADPSSL